MAPNFTTNTPTGTSDVEGQDQITTSQSPNQTKMHPESSDTRDKVSQPSLTTSQPLPISLDRPPRVHEWNEKNKQAWKLWLYITFGVLCFALLISLHRWREYSDIKIFAFPPFLISFTFFWVIFKWRNWLIYLRYLHVPESSEQLLAEVAYYIQLIGTIEKKYQLFVRKDSSPAEFAGRLVDRMMMEEPTKKKRWFYCGGFVAHSLRDTIYWFWFIYPAFRRLPLSKAEREAPLWMIGLGVAGFSLWALHFLAYVVAFGKGVATELETEKMVALVTEDVAMFESQNGYDSVQQRLAWWVHEIYEAGREELLGDKKDLEKGEGV